MFTIEDGQIKITPEILLIDCFKNIWEEDNSPRKEKAIKYFSYIEFMHSPKKSNPYFDTPEQYRKEKVLKAIKLEENELTEKVYIAEEFYKDFLKRKTVSLEYYLSTVKAADKLKSFFETFDLNTRTRAGTPVYKPRDITGALQDTDKVLQNLFSLRIKVEQELFESDKTTKNREINPFETGEI